VNLLLIAENIADAPWHGAALAAQMALRLRDRSCAVRLVCESVADARLIELQAAGVTVVSRAAFCFRHRTAPKKFRAFVDEQVESLREHRVAVVSFSALYAAAVWVPIEETPAIADFRLDDLAHELIGARTLRRKLWEHRALSLGGAQRVQRHLAFAPRTMRPRSPHEALEGRTVNIGFIAPTPLPGVEHAATLRAQTRRLLDIRPDRSVLLLSGDGRLSRDLAPIFTALAHLHHQRRKNIPLMLISAHEPTLMQQLAQRCGLSEYREGFRIVSTTHRPESLLLACDLAGVIRKPRLSPHALSPGRFLCDALRFGRPVLADRSARGSAFIEQALRSGITPPPALLVADNTPAAWYRALLEVMEPVFLRGASPLTGEHPGAKALADLQVSSIDELCDRIVRAAGQSLATIQLSTAT